MQKKAAIQRPDGAQKGFAGRAPLAELDSHADPEQTGRFSLSALAGAVVDKALEGGLSKEKAADVLSALPKEG